MAKNTCRFYTVALLFSIFLAVLHMPIAVQAEQNALADLQIRSDKGDREAQNLLGVRYFTGDGVTKNEFKAAELFTRAARQGLPKAQFNLGYMYHQGESISQDYIQACVWYKAAADQGHSDAQYSYDLLIPYINEEKREIITQLSSQIPAQSFARAAGTTSSHPTDQAHLKDWIKTVHPAAGK